MMFGYGDLEWSEHEAQQAREELKIAEKKNAELNRKLALMKDYGAAVKIAEGWASKQEWPGEKEIDRQMKAVAQALLRAVEALSKIPS